MIDQLQTNSDEATQYLLGVLKGLKISNYPGEDVGVVVSLIRGAVSWYLEAYSNRVVLMWRSRFGYD
jgi:hypothetical protein